MGSVLSDEEFGALFDTVRHSARRLENRNRYEVPSERAREQLFLAGRLTEEHTRSDRVEWERTVHDAVARGVRFERVRVVPGQLMGYQRFLLYQARFNVEYGEDVRYLLRDRACDLDLPDHDFWVFDSTTLLLMPFSADDRLLGCEVVTDPELVTRHEQWIDLAMTHATPYRAYLAEDPARESPPVGAV
ncbi:MAG: hypothetical protein GEV09_06340 [Pseudonocardiaceae bacterium]|nr:hypothetical protein [Pseudonocardiaceae bacterium]